MTLWTKTGTLTKDTTTGDHNQTFSSLWDEAPKVIFIWASKNTSQDTFIDASNISFGWSDGTDDAVIASADADNLASSQVWGTIRNDSIVEIIDETQASIFASLARADVNSLGTTDLVLHWSVATATQYTLKYLAIGGSDITNVKVLNTTLGDTSSGNRDYTGFGFDPEFLMVMGVVEAITAYNANTRSGFNCSVGAALSSSNMWCVETKHRAGTASNDTNIRFSTSRVQTGSGTGTSDNLVQSMSFVAFITDGVTLNRNDAYASATCPLPLLGIKGGLWDIGTFTQKTSTGTQDVSITASRTPKAVMLFEVPNTSADTVSEGVNLSVGASDATNEVAVSWQDVDASDPTALSQKQTSSKVVSYCTANATATDSTVVADADMNDMSTAGKFQLNWTTADATARFLTYVVISETAAAAAADEARRYGINTIPDIAYPPYMVDLLNKITGQRTNIKTMSTLLHQLCNLRQGMLYGLQKYVKPLLHDPCWRQDTVLSRHLRRGTIGRILKTLDKSGQKPPMADFQMSQ